MADFDYASIGGVGFGGGIVLSFVIGMAIPLFGLAAMYFVIMGSAPSTVSRGLSNAARATRRRMYNSGGAAGNSAGGGGDGDGSNSGIYGNGGIGPSVSEAVSNTRVAQADGKVGKAMTATGLDRAVSAGRSAANIGKKGANALPTIGSSPAASAPGSDTAYQEQGGGSSYDGILNQNKAHRGLGDQVADTVSSATKRNKQKAQSFAAGVKSKAQTGKKGGKEKVNEMLPGLKNEPESTVDLGGVGSSDQSDGDSEVSEADEEFAKTIAEKGETAPDVEQGEVGTDGTVDAREEDGDISPAFEGIGADGIEGETGGEIETLDHIFENEEGPVGDDDVEYEIPDEGVGLEGDTTYAYDDREELEEIKDKVVNDDRVTVDKDELERGLNPNKGDGVSEEGFGLDVDQGQQGGRIDVEWADGYDDEVERTANAMGGSRVDGAEGYISTEEMDSFEGEQFTENLHPDSEGDLEEGAEENGATLRPGDWTDGDDMVDGSIFGSESGSERTQYNDNGYDIDHDTANRTDLSGTLDDDPSGRDLVDSSDSSRFNDLDLSDGSTTVGVSHKEEYDELREKVESSDDLEFTKDRAQELLDQPDDNPEEWDAEFTIRGSGDPSDGGDSS